ncbi:hypothetical protein NTGM5_10191 [Candidatus Nitrotoga sp. M5]|nr:hypothetical protein NTGM5_10191 [Candidatus Nitrotoga sp. M5]
MQYLYGCAIKYKYLAPYTEVDCLRTRTEISACFPKKAIHRIIDSDSFKTVWAVHDRYQSSIISHVDVGEAVFKGS